MTSPYISRGPNGDLIGYMPRKYIEAGQKLYEQRRVRSLRKERLLSRIRNRRMSWWKRFWTRLFGNKY